jgi:hypothetical protein
MPVTTASFDIADLPELDDEAALFDASLDPTCLQIVADHIVISLISHP